MRLNTINFKYYPLLLLLSLERYLNTLYKKAVFSKLHFDNLCGRLIHKLSGLDSSVRITSEDEKICFYKKSNSGVESFYANYIEKSIELKPGQSIIFTTIDCDSLLKYLFVELIFLKMIHIKRKRCLEKQYISNSLRTVKRCFKKISKDNIKRPKEKINSKFFSPFKGSIHCYKNKTALPITLSYKNSLIIANISSVTSNYPYISKSKLKQSNLSKPENPFKKPKRIVIFYLDNISRDTSQNLLLDPIRCPNLSEIFLKKEFIKPKQTCTISNWTFPAAISMSCCKKFENHRIFHPELKPHTIINQSIYSSKENKALSELSEAYPNRFRCGTNWRMKPEHGSHSFFNHCMHNPFFGDAYDTCSQVMKQIDIASDSDSIHWVDLMDSHHPVKNNLLPFGSNNFLDSKTVLNGLHYETGPKSNLDKQNAKASSKDIYTSQIINLDRIIGSILNYSYQTISEKDHLLLFISDHGNDFSCKDKSLDRYLEKHQSLFGFIWEGINLNKKSIYENMSIGPFDIFPLLKSICSDDLNISSKIKNYKYSQIFYPGANYEFFYFYSNNTIYKYKTITPLPKKNYSLEKILFNKLSLKNILKKGNWELINNQGINLIDKSKIPNEVVVKLEDVMNAWLGDF